ncbi:hypothetical protein D3C74_411540 [compost metagenome]
MPVVLEKAASRQVLGEVGVLVAYGLEYLVVVVDGALHQRMVIGALLDACGDELLDGVAHRLSGNAQQRMAAGIGHNIMEIQVGLAEGLLSLCPGRAHPRHGLFQLQQIGFGTPGGGQGISR